MADRKTNFLVTMVFDENSDVRKQVDTEIDFKDEIIKGLRNLVKGRAIKHFIVADDTVINEKLNADAIILPDGATNGDMIKAIFPNELLTSITSTLWWGDNMSFNKDWWNAPYKGGCNLSEKPTGSESEDKE